MCMLGNAKCTNFPLIGILSCLARNSFGISERALSERSRQNILSSVLKELLHKFKSSLGKY